MRQTRKSAKGKIKDLKRVLKEGVSAIHESAVEAITAMIVLPGNGREDEPADSWIVNGAPMTHEEYNEKLKERGMLIVERVSESTRTTETTKTTVRVTAEPKIVAHVESPRRVREALQAVEPAKPEFKSEVILHDVDVYDNDGVKDLSMSDADRLAYHREIGQRLIRPFKIG